MKKLSCHCGNVEAEITVESIQKKMRCNCSICKRKGTIMSVVDNENFKIVKGSDKLKLYQFHSKIAKHYFCSNCGIYTHHSRRSDPNTYGINVGCLEGVNPFDLNNVTMFDGVNHPLDKKK